MPDPASKRQAFQELHESGCFAIPNPWDPGSASALAQLGFPALATTSAGFGFSRAQPDTPDALGLDAVLEHIAEIVAAVELPVNADFQAGYAASADGVAANVRRCAATGVAGLSIEDATTVDGASSLFELADAVERIAAARETIDVGETDVLLTARAECYLMEDCADPLAESIRRLTAYSEAGADVLFAPGVREREDIAAIVQAVAPKPVNVLISAEVGLRMEDLAELGVRRVSVGSALSRVAWGAFLRAARTLAQEGSFAGLDGAASFAELNAMFAARS
jgi:2-methylisocitrate lyase-like PEP mutase family enzyme